jgi:hypothetical protein
MVNPILTNLAACYLASKIALRYKRSASKSRDEMSDADFKLDKAC